MSLNKNDSSWKPYADLMAALMVIFMFIAISYSLQVKYEKEKIETIINDYQKTQNELYSSLNKEFRQDFNNWDVELGDDLSVKFTNPDILFARGESRLTPKFKKILAEFLPRYFDIILSERFKNKISEVRIEGHTDRVPAPEYDSDPYIGNILLSQLRSTNVLKYFKESNYYRSKPKNVKKYMRYILTANGLSYGRMLDNDKNLASKTNKTPVPELSRRVEFKILTKTEKTVEEMVEQIKRQKK